MIYRKNYRHITVASLLLVFVIVGGYFVRNSTSVESLSWMGVYSSSRFVDSGLSEIAEFYQNLRIPIPPVMGLLEIISTKLSGSSSIITIYLYRFSLVAVYILAIILAGTTYQRMIISFFISILFLYCTTLIHPQNPQYCDIFCPLFFLIYICLLKYCAFVHPHLNQTGQNTFLPCAAGFFLAMTELTRPYIIFIMPLLVLSSYWSFSKAVRKKQFIAFIFPVLLLSGGWHSYQFIAHQQISFSNNAGVSLLRAWPFIPELKLMVFTEQNQLEKHKHLPIDVGQNFDKENYLDVWANLNTLEHSVVSSQIQQVIINSWLEHPLLFGITAILKVKTFLSGPTSMYLLSGPQSKWFWVYQLIVPATGSLIIFNAGVLCLRGINFSKIPYFLSKPDHLILLFATFSIVILSIGESILDGEGARYLLSVLPLLATLPIFRSYGSDNPDSPKSARW